MCSSASGRFISKNTLSTTSKPLRYHSDPPQRILNFLFSGRAFGYQISRSTPKGITRTLSWNCENNSQLWRDGTTTVSNRCRYSENCGGNQFVSHMVSNAGFCPVVQPLIRLGLRANTTRSASSHSSTLVDSASRKPDTIFPYPT